MNTPTNLTEYLSQNPENIEEEGKITAHGLKLAIFSGTWWAEWMISHKGRDVIASGNPEDATPTLTVFSACGDRLGTCEILKHAAP